MKNLLIASIALLAPLLANAGYGGMGNVESDGGDSVGGPAIIAVAAGAAIGYFVERVYNKSKLDKQNTRYSSEYLGGKIGAIVGAIGLPLLIGLMR